MRPSSRPRRCASKPLDRVEVTAAAGRLDRRDQRGREVFRRGVPEQTHAEPGALAGDVIALLRARLVALELPADPGQVFRLAGAPF